MKLKTGDRVKFLNDTGGGIVTEILDDKTVSVRIEEGFDVPVAAAELILDSEETKILERTDEILSKQGDLQSPEEPSGSVYFGMVPANEATVYKSDFITYLINDCDYYIYYLIGYLDRDTYCYCSSGMLEPETKEHIRTFSQGEISKIRKFRFQLLFFSKDKYDPQPPVDTCIDISTISLYKDKNYRDNEFFNEKALILKIAGDSAAQEKDGLNDKRLSHVPADKEEVDLHIHAIVDNYSGLSEGEILRIQMDKFTRSLENAIQRNTRNIVFIHGVGNGMLKFEIRKTLDTKYPDLSYQDASFKEYGFGATLVKLS
jgi:hypothetical protein